jgi:lactate permease
MLRFWKPSHTITIDGEAEEVTMRPRVGEILMAVAPYAIVIVIFSIAQIPAIKTWLSTVGSVTFAWPFLDIGHADGTAVSAQQFHLDHFGATGTLLLLSGIITAFVYRIPPRVAVREYGATIKQLRWTIVTVTIVLAISFVMNLSGQTTSLGYALASVGVYFAVLSPIIGWIGVALTGSDTASNALFGQLQVQTALQTGLPPIVMAASNTSAGVLGKMVSVQNLAVASAAVGLVGSESALFRRLLGWSIALLALLTTLIVLQTGPLSWMVP